MMQRVPGVVEELAAVRLGDARLDRRLGQIAQALQDRPDASFPQAMGSDAATEGLYRFVANKRVSSSDILQAHVDRTHQRAAQHDRILAVHDTTLYQFSGDDLRDGLFRSTKGKSGFLGHTCIAVSADGTRSPLGLLGMIPIVRPQHGAPSRGTGVVYDNEAHRWVDLVAIVEDEVPGDVEVVHVMDREGDAYELLDQLDLFEVDYVIRLAHDRRVLGEDDVIERMSAALERAPVLLERTVKLSSRSDRKRPPSSRKTHAARDERTAALEIRAMPTWIVRPDGSSGEMAELKVNVVHVVETDAPRGEEPVRWTLLTTLPIATAEDVAAVVDAYRGRWLIEEFFKAVKTGCAYEKRQLESLDALLVAFGLLAPVAWRLLALRWLSRNEPELPATEVLTREQVAFLRRVDNQHRERLPTQPTVREAMFAIARLGGFLARNKVPGWQTLGAGLIRFNDMFRGYMFAVHGERGAREVEDAEM